MTGTSALIVLFGAAGIVLAALLYLMREPGGRGRLVLMALRVGALAVVVLLLLDIEVPGADPARPTPGGEGWVLIDADLSLAVTDVETGETLWEEAVERATESARSGARLALASRGSGEPEGIEPGTLASRGPTHPAGDLIEAVRRLGEAGADSVVVLSSFRRPPGFVADLASATPVPLLLARLGGPVPNAGIDELELPASVPAGETFEGRVSIFGEGGAEGDSVVVEIRADGELRQTIPLPLPAPGRTVGSPLRLPAPADSGTVRYTARVRLAGDRFATDDLRARWVDVGDPEGGVMLVSLVPDWEPRVLLPVLEAVTGLDGEGYLRIGEDRFLTLGAGPTAAEPVPSAAFQDRIDRSELLVVQAPATSGLPGWLDTAVESHPRVLRLLSPGGGSDVEGLELGPSRSGEWTPTAEIPGSPLAPFLAGLRLVGLPPLGGVRVVANPGAGIVALAATRTSGEADPVLIFRDTEAGRRVVALADGFWRWGTRGGEAGRAYRGVWGGTAGWLLESPGGSAGAGILPVDPVQARGEPLRWTLPDRAGDLEIALTPIHDGGEGALTGDAEPGGTAAAYRGPLQATDEGIATTPPVEPGVYRYEVIVPPGDGEAAEPGGGLVEVERWAPSLRLPPLALTSERIEPTSGPMASDGTRGRPLRTHPVPYLLLLGLLCSEWLGRRRLGLR